LLQAGLGARIAARTVADTTMRFVIITGRVIGIVFLPFILGGWLWFDVPGSQLNELVALMPALALIVAAVLPDRMLANPTMRYICIGLCLIGVVQYVRAAAISLQPHMGPDYYASAKQAPLVVTYGILMLRPITIKRRQA
jgi:hypothetical protein